MPNKIDIKKLVEKHQRRLCALSGDPLPDNYSLVDTHRKTHKAQGGTYTEENTVVAFPRAHMAEHGILRDRDPWSEQLKNLMDDRAQIMGLIQKINNQLLALERGTDQLTPETVAMLNEALALPTKRLAVIDSGIAKHLKKSDDPLVVALLGVYGVGPVTAASLLVYVDLEKADSPSALWKYVGLHCASHERYVKGEAGGGNKTLRTVLYNWAVSMEKHRDNPYRVIYEMDKERRSVSDKIVKSRNTQGKLIECAWKDTKPCHRRGAAMRVAIKHFLADFWLVGRTLRGLPTRTLYVEQHLNHDGIIKPAERGWKY